MSAQPSESPINIATHIETSDRIVAPQRARGSLTVAGKRRGAASVLGDLYQSGCLKALFPRCDPAALTAVFLNTSGGMTGGDVLGITAQAGAGSRLTLTSQAAERVYRAAPGAPARLTTHLVAAPGGRIDWLPQETILFNGAALHRRLDVDLAADATFLGVEPLVFGRRAMGETVTEATLADNITVRRDGALVFADALRLDGDIAAQLAGPATGAGAGAVAGVIYAAADAEAHLGALRDMLGGAGGASLIRPGILFVRVLALDSLDLRRILMPVLGRLSGAALPKTWML